MSKQKIFNFLYSCMCFQIRWYRIMKHSIQLRFTGNVLYQYEIDHYKCVKKFSCIHLKSYTIKLDRY